MSVQTEWGGGGGGGHTFSSENTVLVRFGISKVYNEDRIR